LRVLESLAGCSSKETGTHCGGKMVAEEETAGPSESLSE